MRFEPTFQSLDFWSNFWGSVQNPRSFTFSKDSFDKTKVPLSPMPYFLGGSTFLEIAKNTTVAMAQITVNTWRPV